MVAARVLSWGRRCGVEGVERVDLPVGFFQPNFKPLEFGQIEVDSADFWANRWLSSSSRSTAEVLVSEPSNTRTLK